MKKAVRSIVYFNAAQIVTDDNDDCIYDVGCCKAVSTEGEIKMGVSQMYFDILWRVFPELMLFRPSQMKPTPGKTHDNPNYSNWFITSDERQTALLFCHEMSK